jgi:predicted nuclease of predicted toxin-antitoxin system
MNLSPQWVTVVKEQGIEAVHWSAIGQGYVPDNELFDWASEHGYVVLGRILSRSIAATGLRNSPWNTKTTSLLIRT